MFRGSQGQNPHSSKLDSDFVPFDPYIIISFFALMVIRKTGKRKKSDSITINLRVVYAFFGKFAQPHFVEI